MGFGQKMPESISSVLLYLGRGGPYLRDRVVRLLRENRLRLVGMVGEDGRPETLDADAVIVVGMDSDVLKAVQLVAPKPIPLFPVSPPGYTAFFASAEWETLEEGLRRLALGDYRVEAFSMIKSVIDGGRSVYALNEAALFPSRSAALVEYTLKVDGELLWRDRADGIIVSTPTGSTAYAFSAGGPMVLRGADVFTVVPVNSLNPMRRALVVPASSTISLEDVNSLYPCEVVVDGVIRARVRGRVEAVKAEKPALFLRLSAGLSDVIERRERISGELRDMPPSAKFVLKMLETYRELSVKELVEVTGLPERTVRHALATLLSRGLVKRSINLRDARQRVYRPAQP